MTDNQNDNLSENLLLREENFQWEMECSEGANDGEILAYANFLMKVPRKETFNKVKKDVLSTIISMGPLAPLVNVKTLSQKEAIETVLKKRQLWSDEAKEALISKGYQLIDDDFVLTHNSSQDDVLDYVHFRMKDQEFAKALIRKVVPNYNFVTGMFTKKNQVSTQYNTWSQFNPNHGKSEQLKTIMSVIHLNSFEFIEEDGVRKIKLLERTNEYINVKLIEGKLFDIAQSLRERKGEMSDNEIVEFFQLVEEEAFNAGNGTVANNLLSFLNVHYQYYGDDKQRFRSYYEKYSKG